MGIRFSRWATSLSVIATVLLTAGRSWAVFYMLPPSPDQYGLKYDVNVTAAAGDMLNVAFTVADEGRLKPVYSYTVVAFSPVDASGGRSYDVKEKIELKPTADGKRAGQVRIPKRFATQAMIRVLTLTVDGRRQTAGAAYYDIPLARYLYKAPTTATRPAPPPKVAK